jgi:hypothetical protein
VLAVVAPGDAADLGGEQFGAVADGVERGVQLLVAGAIARVTDQHVGRRLSGSGQEFRQQVADPPGGQRKQPGSWQFAEKLQRQDDRGEHLIAGHRDAHTVKAVDQRVRGDGVGVGDEPDHHAEIAQLRHRFDRARQGTRADVDSAVQVDQGQRNVW